VFEQWQYTIAKSTTEENLVRRELAVSKGVLKRLEVLFPFGCEFYAKCRVFIGSKPILPRSSRGYAVGNGFPLGTGDIFESMLEDLPVLIWELWNEDATYPHTLTLSASWISEQEKEALKMELEKQTAYLKDIADALGGKPIQLSELT
jgi:hypothetical protein